MTRPVRRRPWRAIAYVCDWTAPLGRKRVVAGRVAATTPEGLSRWVAEHRRLGHAVDVFVVKPIEGLGDE